MTLPDHSDRTPRWRRWAPACLLLAGIAGQAALMATTHEDRQAGSGFAMFSSVDFTNSRAIVIEGVINGDPVKIVAPDTFSAELLDLAKTPTDDGAYDLAQALHGLRWSIDHITATAGGTTQFDKITVVVRRLTANGRSLLSQPLARGTAS